MFKNAVNLFELFGFKIRIDPSWLLIAALIVWTLSTAYFPVELPGLSRVEHVALAVVAMLGLFASLILHELSHSLVARRFGLKVGGITLFVFGGVAELEQEPRSPRSRVLDRNCRARHELRSGRTVLSRPACFQRCFGGGQCRG